MTRGGTAAGSHRLIEENFLSPAVFFIWKRAGTRRPETIRKGMQMRTALFAALSLVLGLAAGMIGAAPARAEIEYPYCSVAGISVGPDCSFSTLDQCRAFVSGIGTGCERNPRFRAATPAPAVGLRQSQRR
jgi:hypothetical protein